MTTSILAALERSATSNAERTSNVSFRPVLSGSVDWNYRIMVFDRRGLPTFDTRDRNAVGVGTHNGAGSPMEVHVCNVIMERNGDARVLIGHVTLVRYRLFACTHCHFWHDRVRLISRYGIHRRNVHGCDGRLR